MLVFFLMRIGRGDDLGTMSLNCGRITFTLTAPRSGGGVGGAAGKSESVSQVINLTVPPSISIT